MMELDRDLRSIQEARSLANRAFEAWKQWSTASQEQVDRVCAAMSAAALSTAENLGIQAHNETGYGVPEHKHLKNIFAAKNVWDSIKDLKTLIMTLVIAGGTNISFEEAETLKTDPSQQSRLFPIVRPVMEKMGTIITKHIHGYRTESIVLVDGTCLFPGISDVIQALEALEGVPV